MNTMDSRLRKLYRPAAPADASVSPRPSPDEPDYNLLSRFAEGLATEADRERVKRLSTENPVFAELVESPATKLDAPVVHVSPRIVRWWRLLAVASSLLVVGGAAWLMVTSQSGPHPTAAPAPATPAALKMAAPAPTADATVGKALRAATPPLGMEKEVMTKSAPRLDAAPAMATAPAAAGMMVSEAVPGAPEPVANNYAVLIGVDRNEHDELLRNGAVADVQQVAAKLHEFQFNKVIVLTNNLATRAGINAALVSVQRTAGTNASLFVYCAGDTPNEDAAAGNDCVVPYDNPGRAAGRNVQVDALVVSSTPAVYNNGFVVYDNRVPRAQVQRLQQLTRNTINIANREPTPGVQVLMNCNNVQQNVSNVFARAFVQALDQVAVNASVTADDVQGFVANQQALADGGTQALSTQRDVATMVISRSQAFHQIQGALQQYPRQQFIFRRVTGQAGVPAASQAAPPSQPR